MNAKVLVYLCQLLCIYKVCHQIQIKLQFQLLWVVLGSKCV